MPTSKFVDFMDEVDQLVSGSAKEKGYDTQDTGQVGGDLLTFVDKYFSGHSLGEVVYKAVRFRNKKDPKDLAKIAAWAYLEWSKLPMPVPAMQVKPTEMVLMQVANEATKALEARPDVFEADPVRLAGLVCEESGEAMQAALDLTRPGIGRSKDFGTLYGELIQTAAMAIISCVVLRARA